MEKALVSVIVPVYNTAEYVEECIQSILSQSYSSIELILVNDGSTDGSGDICKRYIHLPNVIYIEQEKSGVQTARKCGTEAARGEWVMYVDSDDLLLPGGVERIMGYTEGCSIVISKHSMSGGLKNAPDYLCWEEYLFCIYSVSTGVSPWAKLFKRQLILESPLAFEYNIIRAQDHPMNLAIACSNRDNVAICKEPIYFYRQRPSSTVHTFPFTFDYCYKLCSINDSIVGNNLSYREKLLGGINQRLHYFYLILREKNCDVGQGQPYKRDLITRMNEARVLRLSDRLVLSASHRFTVRICLFLAKIVRRMERPSLVFSDLQRLFGK